MQSEKLMEYKRSLAKLNGLSVMVEYDKKEYIIMFVAMELKWKAKIQVTDGVLFWVEEFDIHKFE